MAQATRSWAQLERFGIIGTPGLNRLRFVDGRDQLISGPAAICDSPETADEIARRWNHFEAMERALREIRTGKTHADNEHPLGEYAGMAFRFHNIATTALAAYDADKGASE